MHRGLTLEQYAHGHTVPPYDGTEDWEWRILESLRQALRAATIEAQNEVRRWLVRWNELEGNGSVVYFESPDDHEGDPAKSIDGRAYHAMRTSLIEAMGDAVHVRGEEDWSTVTILPYEFQILVDPLDGTAPARSLADSHSSVALAYVFRPEGGFRLLAAAICSSSGIVVSWNVRGEIQKGVAEYPPESDEVVAGINPAHPGNLAIVAAKPEDRTLYSAVLAPANLCVVYNTGGTPRTWALIGLELGSLIALKPQAPWDAAYLLPLIDLGGIVRTKAGQVSRAEVIRWFERFSLKRGQTKVIPPHIASSSPASADVTARLLGWETA